MNKVLEFKTPVWLDHIICVTHETAEEHERELRDILSKLQKAGYRASEKKTDPTNTNTTKIISGINSTPVEVPE